MTDEALDLAINFRRELRQLEARREILTFPNLSRRKGVLWVNGNDVDLSADDYEAIVPVLLARINKQIEQLKKDIREL